ncbi:hypothetical protein Bpfe_008449 [Biomphalaria pfeifferi]|uniref:THD domain-containing protein n=1 Tax=Biomphalaria pfeifferi TaxID=112525 RepID=A0AAD8FFX1_BIOPF|nr:hypothetical protein Bpfe_008449 [Biomphalaria pfeifferi]
MLHLFVSVRYSTIQIKIIQNPLTVELFQRSVHFHENHHDCILERCALYPQSSDIHGFRVAYFELALKDIANNRGTYIMCNTCVYLFTGLALGISIAALCLAVLFKTNSNLKEIQKIEVNDMSGWLCNLTTEMNKKYYEFNNSILGTKSVPFTPVSSHKKLKKISETMSDYSNHETFQIKNTKYNDITEHTRGSRVADNSVVIDYSGLYKVYSQLEVTVRSSNPCLKQFVYIHRIAPNNPQNTGVLLRGTMSCRENVTETIFLSGIFHLHSSDQIQVCIGTDFAISINSKNSFVGIFMLKSE